MNCKIVLLENISLRIGDCKSFRIFTFFERAGHNKRIHLQFWRLNVMVFIPNKATSRI